MSILSVIKRSLGFGADDDSLYADTAGTIAAESTEDTREPAGKPAGDGAADGAMPIKFDTAIKQSIFNSVIEIFNTSLPGFIANSVDPEAQRRLLYEALDEDIKKYIEGLDDAAGRYCEARWAATRQSMTEELATMKSRSAEIERRSNEFQQKQLSADRQKRALTERLHELEAQLGRLESEREQTELENRSLVNRIKVANVLQGDLEQARADLSESRAEIARLRANPEAESARRESELQEMVKAKDSEIDDLKKQVEALGASMETLRNTVSESESAIENAAADSARAAEIEAESKARITELTKTVEDKDREIETLKSELKEFESFTSRIDEFETAIARQKETLKSRKAALEERDNLIIELRATIAENLRLQAKREQELQAEIDALRPPTVVSEMTVDFDSPHEDIAPRISEDELSAIEETFESDEWFTKTPPPATPSMRSPEADADFGYRAPRRKSQPPHNPGQLSLF